MKERDIRKQDILERYLKLVEEDCKAFISKGEKLNEVNCPACSSNAYTSEFTKNGFEYVTCASCQTLYSRTRFSFDAIKQFYSQSASTEYWIKEFFAPMAESRREKIFKPRAEYLVDYIGSDPAWFIGDIGAGFGLFLSELQKIWQASIYVAVEPSPEQADICRKMNMQVECCTLEDLQGYDERFDLLTAFELFEHLYEPKKFLKNIYRILKPGGLFLITTLNGEGFDIQVLWEQSNSIYPPCHINFFNPVSLSNLLRSEGFLIEEVETPGKLDWDIVEGAIKRGNTGMGRFWRLLSERGTPKSKRALQKWISSHRFSSHMRILARKKTL
jgi:SAM-dependent methyltransferase